MAVTPVPPDPVVRQEEVDAHGLDVRATVRCPTRKAGERDAVLRQSRLEDREENFTGSLSLLDVCRRGVVLDLNINTSYRNGNKEMGHRRE